MTQGAISRTALRKGACRRHSLVDYFQKGEGGQGHSAFDWLHGVVHQGRCGVGNANVNEKHI